jgi:group I intron endonuclease
MIVYKIENKINGKIYIGLTTKDLSKRISEHIRDNKSPIQKALNKYGLQSFTVTVIDSAESRAVLCEKERYWIQHFKSNTRNKGYNLTAGGDGLVNPSKSVRKRISKKVSALLQGNSRRKGITHSDETKHQISETLKVSMNDPKVKKKMSIARKGKPFTEEHKRNIGLANKGNKRPDLSELNRTRTAKPDYVNSMKGKKRPDLVERNKARSKKQKLYLVASN